MFLSFPPFFPPFLPPCRVDYAPAFALRVERYSLLFGTFGTDCITFGTACKIFGTNCITYVNISSLGVTTITPMHKKLGMPSELHRNEGCNGTFLAWDQRMLEQLSTGVRARFPVVLTHKYACDEAIVGLLRIVEAICILLCGKITQARKGAPEYVPDSPWCLHTSTLVMRPLSAF